MEINIRIFITENGHNRSYSSMELQHISHKYVNNSEFYTRVRKDMHRQKPTTTHIILMLSLHTDLLYVYVE